MLYTVMFGGIVVLGVVCLLGGLRLLIRRGWVGAWFRGMSGLALLAAAILAAIVALDLLSYRQITQDKPIGTISFNKTGRQSYDAHFLPQGEEQEQVFALKGDQWQIDARIIRWKGFASGLAKPAYRLDRIAGRYYSLEDERTAQRTVHALSESGSALDVWQWLQDNSSHMPWVDATYGSAAFVPMRDGAQYEVALGFSGLAVRPLNDPARQALQQWR